MPRHDMKPKLIVLVIVIVICLHKNIITNLLLFFMLQGALVSYNIFFMQIFCFADVFALYILNSLLIRKIDKEIKLVDHLA